MGGRITTYRELWPKQASRWPHKADWLCVYVRAGGRLVRRVIGPPTDKNRERAERILSQIERSRHAEATGSALFADWARRYVSKGMELHELAPSTRPTRKAQVERFAERWDGLRLDEVTPAHLLAWWEAEVVASKARGTETGRRYLAALSCVFQYAQECGVTIENPVRLFLPTVTTRRRTKQHRARRYGGTARPIESSAEVDALFEALGTLGEPVGELLVLLQLDHGMRRGEAYAVRPADVELGASARDTRRIVWVRENRPKGLGPETPKSGLVRAVPLSRRTRQHLRAHFALWPKQRPYSHGWMHPDSYTSSFAPKACRAAGIPSYRPKDLRDTFASRLLVAGIGQVQTMRWMGHAPGSVAMFRERYAKWIGEDEGGWQYRAPVALGAGEVPTDLFARLSRVEDDGTEKAQGE